MSSTTVLCALILGVASVYAFAKIAEYRLRRLCKLRLSSDEFYAAVTAMLENPDLDIEHVRFAEIILSSVASPLGAWGWLPKSGSCRGLLNANSCPSFVRTNKVDS